MKMSLFFIGIAPAIMCLLSTFSKKKQLLKTSDFFWFLGFLASFLILFSFVFMPGEAKLVLSLFEDEGGRVFFRLLNVDGREVYFWRWVCLWNVPLLLSLLFGIKPSTR